MGKWKFVPYSVARLAIAYPLAAKSIRYSGMQMACTNHSEHNCCMLHMLINSGDNYGG